MRKTMMMRAAAAAMTAALVFAQPMSAWAGVVSGGKRATEASEEIAGGPGGSGSSTAAPAGGEQVGVVPGGSQSSQTQTAAPAVQETAAAETQAAAIQPAAETQAQETQAPTQAAQSSDQGTGTVGPSAGPGSDSTSSSGEAAPSSQGTAELVNPSGEQGSIVPVSSGSEGTEASGQSGASQASSGQAVQVSGGNGLSAGGGVYNSSSRSVNNRYPLPGSASLNSNPGSVDIGGVVAGAGLEALGTGNTPPDDILQQVQICSYQMMDANGNRINYTATNDPGNGLFNPEGFSKFYMIHAGVARFYYRTYTDAHGWSPWCVSKETTPLNDDGAKVQAIQIRCKGYVHTFNDVYYKVVLNDGTVLDWAKNGQTTGTMGTDRYIVAIRVGLWNNKENFPFATQNLMAGCSYDGAYIDDSGIHYSTYNGQPYTGWAFIDQTQYYFENSQPVSGWKYVDGYKYYFNSDGSVVTDLEPIMGLQSSYQINYNKSTRTFYVMAADGGNGYIIPYKTFNSTCGPATPLGDFNTYAKYDVKYMHDDVPAAIYCKYLSRFYNGFIIHSILFYGTKLELDAITYNYIDDAASGGCIRLLTGDAYWVYKNCPMGTRVHIYEDRWNKGPVEKGACDQCIPREQTWDPTDPSSAEAVAALQAAAQAEQERAAAIASGSAEMTEEERQLAEQLQNSAQ